MNKILFPSVNGISCLTENKWTVAIINCHGNKKVSGSLSKIKMKIFDIWFVRGIAFFILGIFCFIKTYLNCSKLDEQEDDDKNVAEKIANRLNIASIYVLLFASVVLGFLFAFLVLGVLPPFVIKRAFGTGYSKIALNTFTSILRVALIYLTMIGLRFAPFMHEIYRFNGACCQAVNAKFKTSEIDKSSIFQPLNFLNFMLFAFLTSTFVISLISIKVAWYADPFINLAILITCISLCYEILFILEKANVKGLKEVVVAFAWLVSMRPSVTHKEAVKVALIEQNYDKDYQMEEENLVSMSTLLAEMQTKLLSNERYDKSDVDWLIANVLGKNRAEIKLVKSVSEKEYRDILRATERRSKGEPISSIFGFVEFYGLRFDVNKKVLSPRPETEILVEEIVKLAKTMTEPEICDLCTGSGAIAVSVAKNCKCKVSAIDISKSAITLAKNNAEKNHAKVDFILSDLFEELKKNKKFDIIVSNPPYIKSEDVEKLDLEVKNYDPRLALDGGNDGLDFYRKIVANAPKHLKSGGFLFFEVGQGQAGDVQKIMQECGFVDTHIVKDYNKIERIIYGRTREGYTRENAKSKG